MDPWKDDRVRDFVAINTIQRLRAYHLPATAPMPAIEEVNAMRALNLILLPRADPDYRPCLGEQPPSRAQLRARRRAKERQGRRERRRGQQQKAHGNGQGGSSPEYSSTSASASSSTNDSSDVDGETTSNRHATSPVTNTSLHTDPASLTKQAGLRSPIAFCAATAAASSTQCAIDRARAVFFGASSFTSSTSPRRLVNSPHVPLTPSMESAATITGRPALHTPHSPKDASHTPTTGPLLYDARAGQRQGVREGVAAASDDGSTTVVPPTPPVSSAARSLGMELDAYIEANSTPLRPPPRMRHASISAEAKADEAVHTTASAKAESSEPDVSPSTPASAAPCEVPKPRSDVPCGRAPSKAAATAAPLAAESSPNSLEATPAALRPPSPRLVMAGRVEAVTSSLSHGRSSSSSATDMKHTCDVCDAIIQYYQSMLTRGVVLDRYNHKDLAFAWWVLGRNMDVAALESRGPIRREALMITLRNFYYTLLSAEEAKAKVTAAEGEKSDAEGGERERAGGAATAPSPGGGASFPRPPETTASGGLQGVGAETEEHSRRASGKAAASRGHADSLGGVGTGIAATALKRRRPDKSVLSPYSGEEEHGDEHAAEEDSATGGGGADGLEPVPAAPMRGRTSAPPPLKKAFPIEMGAPEETLRAAGGNASVSSSSALGQGLSASMRGEDDEEAATHAASLNVGDALGTVADTLRIQTGGDAPFLASSATASCAGSMAPGSSVKARRRHRCAAERDKAVEETWASTRTGRRAAAIKAAAQLELQGSADAMAFRKPIEAAPSADTPRASRTAAAKRLKKGATATVMGLEAVATSVAPLEPASSSATSKVQRKRSTASKRARSLSRENSADEGQGSLGSGSGADSDVELRKEEEKRINAEAPRTVLRGSTHKSKSRDTVPAKAATAANAHPSSGMGTAPSPEATTTGTTAAAATAPKKGGRGEEHRGRPRGSFKITRISSAAAEVQVISVLASVARSAQRRRDVGETAATPAGTLLDTAASDRRSNSAGIGIACPPSCAPPKAGEGPRTPEHPLCEIPLRLTPHERAVRSRIQQRMGVPLPAPPPRSSTGPISHGASLDAQRAALYSSYTFLLSSFRTAIPTQLSHDGSGHERRAITAPALWYGQVISPAAAGGSTCTSSSGASQPRLAREKAVAMGCSNAAGLNGSAPSLSAAIATVAVAPTRQRGRRPRIEGGVDPCLRSNILWHDQAALERLVKARLAQAAEPRRRAAPPTLDGSPAKCHPTVPEVPQLNEEHRRGSEEAVKTTDEGHEMKRGMAVADLGVDSPAPPTGSALSLEDTTALGIVGQAGEDVTAATEEAVAPALHRGDSAQRAPLPPASAFGDLPYAQQCLLVWSAAGLLERHVHQRQMEVVRRGRLLERCGRMATRRMAARVAAAVQGGITNGNAHDDAENGVVQLAGELGGGSGESDSSASADESDASGDEAAVEERACTSALGRSRGTSRKADGEDPLHCLQHVGDPPATSRSSSANSSSASSEERFRSAMRPLPRRVYDYWAPYRRASDNG
ncbi:hypothetical protein LSCM1_04231 [Leishmania martiniquensis]|uniref:Uncharacterized protein n=1 Tax=Leishmania martiniquensis TaxID=1580590 RepID=A0A836G777_9TRYP|nr:hypothetical protein LSCM1_04231 [Leishmania martiniquensis]